MRISLFWKVKEMVRVLIIGGGIAGIHVLQELLSRRKEIENAAGSKLEITLLKKERSGWLSTCGLPFALQGIYEIETTEITKAEEFISKVWISALKQR